MLAAILGDTAAEIAAGKGVTEAVTGTHEALGSTAAVLLAALALLRAFTWWRGIHLDGGRRSAVILAEAAIAVVVLVTALYGGNLVYEHGVNVAARG